MSLRFARSFDSDIAAADVTCYASQQRYMSPFIYAMIAVDAFAHTQRQLLCAAASYAA